MLVLVVTLVLSLHGARSHIVTIHNDIPRRDINGHIVDAHDGGVYHFNSTFFLYGTVYENCSQGRPQCRAPCGYTPNTFALYTSPDLTTWKLHSTNILPGVTRDNQHQNYWMPNVAYNPKTGKYVMQYWSTHCGFHSPCLPLAVADTPYGPFVEVPPPKLHGGTPSSQMGWFVDTDGKAYAKYNTIPPGQHHVVEELTDDWMSSTGRWAIVFWKPTLPWMEGGGMFKRGSLYYYMTGSDCCFCQWGGGARVWTARHPLGPWYPGVAPELPTVQCDLTGDWRGAGPSLPSVSFTLSPHGSSKNNFTYRDGHGSAVGWVDPNSGYVTFPPSAGNHRGVLTSADGKRPGCDRVAWYGYESFIWCRNNHSCHVPTPNDPTEANLCADGKEPAQGVRVNPCDPGKVTGTNFTIPAQQFNVISVPVSGGVEVLYYGERANTAPDGLKSHDYQAWVPIRFADNGDVLPLTFPKQFTLDIDV